MDLKKQKVGLLTFLYSSNLGSVLQAYSLQKVISELGYDAEYITFCSYKNIPILIFLNHIKYYLEENGILSLINYLKNVHKTEDILTNKKCLDFYKKIPHTEEVYNYRTIKFIEKKYSTFIVGSDQVWSPEHIFSRYFFYLNFLKDDCRKKSYASSLGMYHISNAFEKYLTKKLTLFQDISCRDYSHIHKLKKITNKPVALVVDPTLLYNAERWSNEAQPIEIADKYLLCYFLKKPDNNLIKEIVKKGKKLNLPICDISTSSLKLDFDLRLNSVNPLEFIYLIKKAEMVFTDSYHGTIFSANFNTTFFSIYKHCGGYKKSDNNRIHDFLTEYKLTKQLLSSQKEYSRIDSDHKVSFQYFNKKIQIDRDQSINYLKNILK